VIAWRISSRRCGPWEMVTRLLAGGLDVRGVDVALPMGWTLP
jgi:hypothetical protein